MLSVKSNENKETAPRETKGVAERIGKAVWFGMVWGKLRIVSVSETINHRERLKE